MTQRIVIIGGGFGGLAAAKTLARAFSRSRGAGASAHEVILLDASNHHLFQPLLYQVATAGLSAPAIASPIRYILRRQQNVSVFMAQVTQIDTEAQIVRCGERKFAYDYLLVAAGAQTSYFGNTQWETVAPGLKTLDDAFEIRRRVINAFEAAELEDNPASRAALLCFTVIGGGPTGVELAGTLIEIARHTLKSEFRRIDPASATVLLVEGAPRILGAFSDVSAARAQRQLERLGVQVLCGKKVSQIDAQGVQLQDSTGATQQIASATVLWAAGVRASPVGAMLGGTLDRSGRVSVTAQLHLPDQPNVFVVGDLAHVPSHPTPVPGVAPAAKQMGRCAAQNILAHLSGNPLREFRYQDYGSLATIGRHAAVVEFGRLRFSGFLAWAFWLFIHIFFLIGFRNRFVVMLDWAWSYLSFERFARIITRKSR